MPNLGQNTRNCRGKLLNDDERWWIIELWGCLSVVGERDFGVCEFVSEMRGHRLNVAHDIGDDCIWKMSQFGYFECSPQTSIKRQCICAHESWIVRGCEELEGVQMSNCLLKLRLPQIGMRIVSIKSNWWDRVDIFLIIPLPLPPLPTIAVNNAQRERREEFAAFLVTGIHFECLFLGKFTRQGTRFGILVIKTVFLTCARSALLYRCMHIRFQLSKKRPFIQYWRLHCWMWRSVGQREWAWDGIIFGTDG